MALGAVRLNVGKDGGLIPSRLRSTNQLFLTAILESLIKRNCQEVFYEVSSCQVMIS